METENNDWAQSLDREVTALGRAHASTMSTQEAQQHQLDRMEHALEALVKPKPPVQMLGAISVIATLIVVFGVFLELRLTPMDKLYNVAYQEIVRNERSINELFHQATENQVRLAITRDDYIHLDEMHHITVERVDNLETNVGAIEAVAEILIGGER